MDVILQVVLLKSVVAYFVFTRPANGSISFNNVVTFAALLHLSLIGGIVANTVVCMLIQNAIAISVRIIQLDDIDGDVGIVIVVVAEYRLFG